MMSENLGLKKLYQQIDKNTVFEWERSLFKKIIEIEPSLERGIEIVNFLQSPFETATLFYFKETNRYIYRHRTLEAINVFMKYGDIFKILNMEICEPS